MLRPGYWGGWQLTRNGEVVAVVRIELKPIIGQTEKNALERAVPVLKRMQQQVKDARDLTE